ncbi:MAG: MogA/MoaB family molybdenum cofactor biosynthesis protein [Desulfobacterales bacterium]|nr:MogA/MoaB family molybdenum cofactor biosynthesis protein [Desulfobacterales bacterium]
MGIREHKKAAPLNTRVGILTVSTTRSLEDDKGGGWIKKKLEKEGHEVVYHQVVTDDHGLITSRVHEILADPSPQILLVTGGTGISPRDVTIEAVKPMFEKELTAFGTLFAKLSYEEIDSAAILSRATAGTINNTVVFCIPGSLNACKLACKALIIPELGHLVKHIAEP